MLNVWVVVLVDILLVVGAVVGTRYYYKSEISLVKEDSLKVIRALRKEKAEAYNKGFIDGIMAQKVNEHKKTTDDQTAVIPVTKG